MRDAGADTVRGTPPSASEVARLGRCEVVWAEWKGLELSASETTQAPQLARSAASRSR